MHTCSSPSSRVLHEICGLAVNPRVDLEPVFLIHRRAYRESSALLEIFSREHGRVGVVARGINRPRSTLRAASMPFTSLLMSWSGRGELATLRAVEVAPMFWGANRGADAGAEPGIMGALVGNALLSGLYINELLMRLTHRHDPHPELFDAYAAAVHELTMANAVEQTLRVFEKRILESIGYGLILSTDADDGSAVLAGQRYRYVADRGATRDPHSVDESVEVSGETLLCLAAERSLNNMQHIS